MKVAAYQAPLIPCGSLEAIDLIRRRVHWCEAEGVEVLCCPEAILGGLAEDAAHPADFAMNVASGQLSTALKPLASKTVTTIVGFTETTGNETFYNSAAVFHRGSVIGLFRKLYPAIRKSIYRAGEDVPVFRVGDLTFGIIVCNDSNYREPARLMASQGATALFIPTNNGLPITKADVVADARKADIALATQNDMWIIRADVAGRTADLISYGSSGIVDPDGMVIQTAKRLSEDILVADIGTARAGLPCFSAPLR
ncbi:MAG: carbon-nitrogen hydrolase family protein [Acidobacteriota bacterium]